jgi:hypothetical protein
MAPGRPSRERIFANAKSISTPASAASPPSIPASSPTNSAWKQLLEAELAAHAKGELGWSSQWRKADLPRNFPNYACEAFCDTAAWLFSACPEHEEYTLANKWRARRRAWFLANPPFHY